MKTSIEDNKNKFVRFPGISFNVKPNIMKNPGTDEFVFVILMLVFIIWSMGTYSIGIISANIPLEEILLAINYN